MSTTDIMRRAFAGVLSLDSGHSRQCSVLSLELEVLCIRGQDQFTNTDKASVLFGGLTSPFL